MTNHNQDEAHLIGVRDNLKPEEHGQTIDWDNSKIKFVTDICRGKSVLDLGCVQHDARFANNKDWLHKAIKYVASDVIGLDLYKPGVEALQKQGYNVIYGDAQDFDLEKTFDVIVAGDLIEHLSNFGDFLKSCVKHMNHETRLIICTPNPWHWHKVVKAFKGPVPVNEEHTCWLCPQTYSQLAARYGLEIERLEYGSIRTKDSFLPLPMRLRHASWYSVSKLTATR